MRTDSSRTQSLTVRSAASATESLFFAFARALRIVFLMICAAFLGENSTSLSASEALSPWQAPARGRPLNADILALRIVAT